MGGRNRVGETGDGCPVEQLYPVAQANPGHIRVKVGTKVRPSGRKKVSDPSCQENSRSALHVPLTVPQTDTGRWGENPKALVRTLVQELGKMTP